MVNLFDTFHMCSATTCATTLCTLDHITLSPKVLKDEATRSFVGFLPRTLGQDMSTSRRFDGRHFCLTLWLMICWSRCLNLLSHFIITFADPHLVGLYRFDMFWRHYDTSCILAAPCGPEWLPEGDRHFLSLSCHFHAGEDVCRSFFLKALEGHLLPGIPVLENQRTTFTRCFDCAGAEWIQPTGPNGPIPRKTAWMVYFDCTCTYRISTALKSLSLMTLHRLLSRRAWLLEVGCN